MCPRCRHMRNPDKYECTPLDPNNPFGGCRECEHARFPCNRREYRADQRAREGVRARAIIPWRRDVHSDEDVQSCQDDHNIQEDADPPIAQISGRCVTPFHSNNKANLQID